MARAPGRSRAPAAGRRARRPSGRAGNRASGAAAGSAARAPALSASPAPIAGAEPDLLGVVDETARFLTERARMKPRVGIILGSGLGPLADRVDASLTLPYGEIPHFPVSTVAGHSGRLLVGRLEGQPVAVMQGRIHLYEGYTAAQVVFPVRVMRAMGIDTLIVTNAAGGLNRLYGVGDLMLITDMINFMFQNPLRGPNDERLGPRFPDMSQPFCPELMEVARRTALDQKLRLREGVYMAVTGPSYETPAELRFMSRMADAVGMSTVPEVIAARHAGVQRILGITVITDKATGEAALKVSHEEVVEAARVAGPRFVELLRGIVQRL